MNTDEIRKIKAEGALRTLDILTAWQLKNPDAFFVVCLAEQANRIEVVFTVPPAESSFFGESVQDALAQAAQVIGLNGGEL